MSWDQIASVCGIIAGFGYAVLPWPRRPLQHSPIRSAPHGLATRELVVAQSVRARALQAATGAVWCCVGVLGFVASMSEASDPLLAVMGLAAVLAALMLMAAHDRALRDFRALLAAYWATQGQSDNQMGTDS